MSCGLVWFCLFGFGFVFVVYSVCLVGSLVVLLGFVWGWVVVGFLVEWLVWLCWLLLLFCFGVWCESL